MFGAFFLSVLHVNFCYEKPSISLPPPSSPNIIITINSHTAINTHLILQIQEHTHTWRNSICLALFGVEPSIRMYTTYHSIWFDVLCIFTVLKKKLFFGIGCQKSKYMFVWCFSAVLYIQNIYSAIVFNLILFFVVFFDIFLLIFLPYTFFHPLSPFLFDVCETNLWKYLFTLWDKHIETFYSLSIQINFFVCLVCV